MNVPEYKRRVMPSAPGKLAVPAGQMPQVRPEVFSISERIAAREAGTTATLLGQAARSMEVPLRAWGETTREAVRGMDNLTNIIGRMRAVKEESQGNWAAAHGQRDMFKLLHELEGEGDQAAYEKKWREGMQKILTQRTQGLPSHVKNAVAYELEKTGANYYFQGLSKTWQNIRAEYVSSLQGKIISGFSTMFKVDDQMARNAELVRMRDAITQAKKSGYISADEESKSLIALNDQYAAVEAAIIEKKLGAIAAEDFILGLDFISPNTRLQMLKGIEPAAYAEQVNNGFIRVQQETGPSWTATWKRLMEIKPEEAIKKYQFRDEEQVMDARQKAETFARDEIQFEKHKQYELIEKQKNTLFNVYSTGSMANLHKAATQPDMSREAYEYALSLMSLLSREKNEQDLAQWDQFMFDYYTGSAPKTFNDAVTKYGLTGEYLKKGNDLYEKTFDDIYGKPNAYSLIAEKYTQSVLADFKKGSPEYMERMAKLPSLITGVKEIADSKGVGDKDLQEVEAIYNSFMTAKVKEPENSWIKRQLHGNEREVGAALDEAVAGRTKPAYEAAQKEYETQYPQLQAPAKGGALPEITPEDMDLVKQRRKAYPAEVGASDGEKKHMAMARQIAEETDVDPNIFCGLIMTESKWNPTAVSTAGAAGLAQFMPGTAKAMGLRVDSQVDQRFDPELSLRAGAKYLKKLLGRYNGNYRLAIAAYNTGPGNVKDHVPANGETEFHGAYSLYFAHQYQRHDARDYGLNVKPADPNAVIGTARGATGEVAQAPAAAGPSTPAGEAPAAEQPADTDEYVYHGGVKFKVVREKQSVENAPAVEQPAEDPQAAERRRRRLEMDRAMNQGQDRPVPAEEPAAAVESAPMQPASVRTIPSGIEAVPDIPISAAADIIAQLAREGVPDVVTRPDSLDLIREVWRDNPGMWIAYDESMANAEF